MFQLAMFLGNHRHQLGVSHGVPSGKHTKNYGKIHHAIHGKIHDFDWAMFNSYVKLPEGIIPDLTISQG